MSREKRDILGLHFDNITMEEAVAIGSGFLDAPGASICVTPNAEIAYDAYRDPSFCALLNGADLMLPDGAGVVLAAKLQKKPVKQKVAGIEFAAEMIGVFASRGTKLFLLGSKPGVADLAAEKMKERFPGLVICGTADGYFKDDSEPIAKINASGAEALFVCLGAPKQERFMFSHRDELCVRFMAGLGGTLDGFAGTVKRAPKWMIKLQLEWLFRLLKEPKRFGRMLRLPKYIWVALTKRRKEA